VIGATIVASGAGAVNGHKLLQSVLVRGGALAVCLRRGRAAWHARGVSVDWMLRAGDAVRGYRLGQIGSASLVSLAHGTNDVQKTMGVISLALIAHGDISTTHFYVPF
jgi:inorganic phosphate transporter, PiT family